MTEEEEKDIVVPTKQEVTRIVTSADVKWFVATMASVAVGAVILISWIDAKASEKAKVVQEDLNEFKKEVRETLVRQDQKTDAILTGLHLYNPAPAPKPLDAGSP